MLKRLILALIPVIACAAPVFADPITVTAGNVTLGSAHSGVDPPFGFSLIGDSTSIIGETFAFGLSGFNSGQIVDLSTTVAPSFVNHPLPETVDGVMYSAWLRGQLTFAAAPFVASASTFTTPFTMTVIQGSTNSISAPTPQSLGATYTFASWSDGGAQKIGRAHV